MVADQIERDVLIAAPIERVWAIITEPEHIRGWFGNGELSTVDLRPGGEIVFRHPDVGEIPAHVVDVTVPTLLSYRWASHSDVVPGNDTLVEMILTPEGGGTRLTVRESGFSALTIPAATAQREYDDHVNGWTQIVAAVREQAERVSV